MMSISPRGWVGVGLATCLAGWIAIPSLPTAWSPYQVGAGVGVLSWVTFYCADKPLGASSFYANLAGLLGQKFAPAHTADLKYFKDEPPKLNYGVVFMVCAVVGAFLAALNGGQFSGTFLPPLWIARFGEDSVLLRSLVAFAGGAVMAVGARLADGCTSGHGISGALQLAVSSWLTLAALFAGGTATAFLLYGGLR